MSFYGDMAKMAADLLKPDAEGGLGQQDIVLVQMPPGPTYTPLAEDWHDPVINTARETLRAAARGVSADMIGRAVGEAVIVASDRVVTAAVPQLDPHAGDHVLIDGRSATVLSVEWLPAAGIKAAVRMIVR